MNHLMNFTGSFRDFKVLFSVQSWHVYSRNKGKNRWDLFSLGKKTGNTQSSFSVAAAN